ncbi:hypothetical protein [Spirosoma harenae]
MKIIRWYSPGGEAEQGGNTADGKESAESHEPGNTPLADQEELPGGYIHGHAEPDEADE